MLQDRIKQIIDNEHLSIRKFEEKICATNGVVSKCLRKGTDINANILISIVNNFPQYSPNWLLTGQGNMLQSEAPEGCSGGVGVQTKEDETVPQQIERLAKEAAYWKAKFEDATKK